jgi:DNA polymerase-1
MSTAKRLFLIDGTAIAYRSYYAFIQRPLINSKGQNTSAIYGFVTFLNRILTEESPDYVAVVFDTAAPTFRHKAYKEYKATRQKMPEDMSAQLIAIKVIVNAYRIPVLEMDGYEADDVIGTLAKRAEREKVSSFLVTADKDFMQLVSQRTKIYKPGRQGTDVEIVGIEGVKKKFGVAPNRVVDVLGLVGDTSDNVPGVPGVGEKTAIPLVQKFGRIEDIYKNINKIEQKGVRHKLEINKDKALLSKELVTIDTEVPIKVDFHTLKAAEKDTQALMRLFEELEFRSLLSSLKKSGRGGKPTPSGETEFPPEEIKLSDIRQSEHSYRLVTSLKELKDLCSKLRKAKEFVFDTETTSTDPLNAELVGISFSLRPHEAFFVPVRQAGAEPRTGLFDQERPAGGDAGGLEALDVVEQLMPILQDPAIRKVGHNIKYDMLVLSQYRIWTDGIWFDTMIANYILRADSRHNLDSLAKEYLQYKTVSYDDLTGSGKDRKLLRDVSLEALSDYSCEDADVTFQLYETLAPRLKEQGMVELCEEVEFPLISVLAKMEKAGVAIDVGRLRDMSKELERELQNLTREIHKLAGEAFNINSTQQLGDVLFNKLKLPTVRKTKTGFSTDVGVLETLRNEHPIVEHLLNFRQLSKLKSTYVDALPSLINPRSGRVHTSFNQTIAATGRLSSSDPNLQNIPIRTDIGRLIREAFVPGDEGNLLMSADYSQIELRVMAHISGDEGLAEAFRNQEDVHASTAAKVFGVSLNDVTREMRRKAKEVNFGIMYGIGPYGLANRLEITQTEAKEIIARYFERFPKVKEYINDTIETARGNGYVETLLGRRRYLPDLNSHNMNLRQNAERQAINMPIQGTAADMIKLAMINIDGACTISRLETKMLLQVHDELVFELKKDEEAEVRRLVTRHMQESLKLSVPLQVEIGVGKNWLEAH